MAQISHARPPWVTLTWLSFLTMAIGWADCVTGWELSLSVIYGVPILLGIWRSGRNMGLFLALLSAPVWWLANQNQSVYQTDWGYNLALLNREIFWLFIAFGGSAIRTKQQAYEAQIRMLMEMRQMGKEIVGIAEHEQQRIGQDLHDGLCQQLAAIGCATRALADDLHARGIPEVADAEKIEEAIQETAIEARNLARGIFPVHVTRCGLAAALEELASRTALLTGTHIAVRAEAEIKDPEVAMHLYRIVQEAMANAIRHGGARHVMITLHAIGHQLELRVDDDGKGFNVETQGSGSGMGLRTMKYRAQSMDATFAICPGPEGGTSVVCHLPMPPP